MPERVILPPQTVTEAHLESIIQNEEYVVFGGRMTICVLTTKSGFMVIGESSCVHPKQFNKEIGQRYAREQAFDRLWQLEGYLLRNQLHNEGVL